MSQFVITIDYWQRTFSSLADLPDVLREYIGTWEHLDDGQRVAIEEVLTNNGLCLNPYDLVRDLWHAKQITRQIAAILELEDNALMLLAR